MARRMIWIEDEHFTGWCCSHCHWGITAPRLESSVAALAFNWEWASQALISATTSTFILK